MAKISLSHLPAPLKAPLKTADTWLRLQEGVQLLFPAISLGLSVTLFLVWLGRFYPLAFPLALLGIGLSLTFLGLVGIWLYTWFRPRSPLVVARLLDRRLNLEERLSTCVELTALKGPTPPAITQAQLGDTLHHLEKFNPGQSFPLGWSRRWAAAAGLLLVLIIAGLVMPNPQTSILQQQAENEALLQEQAAQLEKIQAELLAEPPLLETPEGEVLRQTLDELIEALQEGQLSPEEAMAEFAEAEQTLTDLQEANGQETELNELAEAFSRFDSTEELAEALEQGDFNRAAEALSSLDEGATDAQTRQEMAQALREAAQAAEQAGNTDLAEALNAAAEALQEAAAGGENSQAMQEALEQAAQALSEAGQEFEGQEAVQEALANIQEAREQLAEANGQGTGQGQQPGMGQGDGQGTGPGQQPGLAQGNGQGGAGREDPDSGADGLLADQGAPSEMSTGNGPNEGRTGEYESIYAPLHLGGEGGPLVNPDPQGAEGGMPIGTTPADPNREPNAAQVPYNQVYGQYNEAASRALDDSYIPLGMKSYVRNYFGALEPE